MKKRNKILVLSFFLAIITIFMFVAVDFVKAQTVNEGVQIVGEQTGLGSEDPRVIVARVIRIVLGFLGIVTLAIIIYGGFLYMTAGGNDTNVDTAKKWIINGVIGLVIILLAFSITSYVIGALSAATGVVPGDGTGGGTVIGGGGGGGTAVGSFVVNIYPQGDNKPLNSVVKVSYPYNREPLVADDYKNAKENIKVYKLVARDEGSIEEVEVSGSINVDGKIITFVPDKDCPADCKSEKCFDENSNYKIKVLNLVDSNNQQISCPKQLEGYCVSAEFSTISSCDNNDPKITLGGPVMPVKIGEVADFESFASDDFGISTVVMCPSNDKDYNVCDSIGPDSTQTPTEFTSSFFYETRGYDLGVNVASAQAFDISNNSSTTTKKYLIASENCFDDQDNFSCLLPSCEIEDCQGNDYCYEDENGKVICGAWTFPIITNVSPSKADVGSYVTITGLNFGAYDLEDSKILINGVEADFPCGNTSWSKTQVIIRIPDDATTGKILLQGVNGFNDTLDYDSPGWKGEFIVAADDGQDEVGLCSVTNSEGEKAGVIGSFVYADGDNFGEQDYTNDAVVFNGQPAPYVSTWNKTQILDIKVPNIKTGNTLVQVKKDKVYSNPVAISVKETARNMSITSVDPAQGAPNQMITITGNDFGLSGGVNFIDQEDENSIYKASFGCDGAWQNNQIVAQLPNNIVDGNYTLQVVSGSEKATTDFTVDKTLPLTPGICQIKPNNGPVGSIVSIEGNGFGNTSSVVKFSGDSVSQGFDWTINKISNISVPALAKTGSVSVVNADNLESNKVNFSVSSCQFDSDCNIDLDEVCCNKQSCTQADECEAQGPSNCEYSWYFSTGNLPKVPKIINRDCVLGEYSQSPSPQSNQACPNSMISFTFNLKMQASSLLDKIEVRKCALPGETCDLDKDGSYLSSMYPLNLRFDVVESTYNKLPVTQVILNSYGLSASTSYKVVVSGGAFAAENSEFVMPNEYQWSFKTASQDCELSAIEVTPQDGLIQEIDQSQLYRVLGQSANCGIIDVPDEGWSWDISSFTDNINRIVRVVDANFLAGSKLATFNSVGIETILNNPGVISSNGFVKGISFSDSANLTIKYKEPLVVDVYPNCNAACRNSVVGAEFNTYIEKNQLENIDNVKIYKCLQKDCEVANLQEVVIPETQIQALDCKDYNGASYCKIVNIFSEPVLEVGTYYRVVLDEVLTSISGYQLTGLNYSFNKILDNDNQEVFDSYSWTFKTKDTPEYCRLEKVEIDPSYQVSSKIGEEKVYVAYGLGAADECRVEGQKLNPFKYNWLWSSYDNKGVVVDALQGYDPLLLDDKLIAIITSNYSYQGQSGCDENCVQTGSTKYAPVCGNGVIEAGEECEDGNIVGSDGCSANCLNEGSRLDSCGNGTKDDNEECDDGNNDDNDGCSKFCLNEGSSRSGFNCGNSIVEFGEDADYGQVNRLYGINSNCLHTGSIYTSADNKSICGNQRLEAGEECEARICKTPLGKDCDFNQGNCVCTFVGDDLCTNTCEYNGFEACTDDKITNCCGNGVVETYDLYLNYLDETFGPSVDGSLREQCEAGCQRDVYYDTQELCEAVIANSPDKVLESSCHYDAQESLWYVNQTCTLADKNCNCEMPQWCSEDCLLQGSSFTYESYCGDGVVGNGEDAFCENEDVPVTTRPGSPIVIVNVLGNLENSKTYDSAILEATTKNISIDEDTTEVGELKSGTAELQYVWDGVSNPPSDCDPNNPPQIVSSVDGKDICINAKIEVIFNREITSTDGSLDEDNVVLQEVCSAQVNKGLLKTFVEKVKSFVNNLIKREVFAADWCNVENIKLEKIKIVDKEGVRLLISATDENGQIITLTNNNSYRLKFINLANKCNIPIVDQPVNDYVEFTTNDEYCHFDSVEVSPAYKFSSTSNEKWDLFHYAKSGELVINQIVDQYEWKWQDWQISDSQIVKIEKTNCDCSEGFCIKEPTVACESAISQTKNGLSSLTASAVVSKDKVFNEGERLLQGSGSVEVFICENPWLWPSADMTVTDSNDAYNAVLRYCRDQGNSNDKTDDLPLLRDILTPKTALKSNCNNGLDDDGDGGIDFNNQAFFERSDMTHRLSTDEFVELNWDDTLVTSFDFEQKITLRKDDIVYNYGRGGSYTGDIHFNFNGETKTFNLEDGILLQVNLKMHPDRPSIVYQIIMTKDLSDVECSSLDGFETEIQTDDLLTEFFFLRQNDEDYQQTNDNAPDAISMRVYKNPLYLSARQWYEKYVPNQTGGLSDITIGCDYDPAYDKSFCYHGVKDGNTIYVSGGNVSNNTLYNNIYVIGYSQKANSNTLNIFGQLISNLRLADNMSYNSNVYQAMKRDIIRLNDVNYIISLLENYKQTNGSYPALQEGTYNRGMSLSAWPSWQAVFANELGSSLPMDPINKFEIYSPTINNVGTLCDGSSNNLKCRVSHDQCYNDGMNYLCSICDIGSDINTCYDSETLQIGLSGTAGAEFWSSMSFLYGYGYNNNTAQLFYNLEGDHSINQYYIINNKPTL